MTWRAVFEAGAEVGRDLDRVDWTTTPLGPPDAWPDELLNALRMMLTSRFAMWMAWGPDLTFFCNDAYRRDTLGSKYPWALGRPASEVWGEIWGDIGPRIRSVLVDGAATWDESLLLFLERSGYREETYHTFSYSPLTDSAGTSVGMLCVVAEETDKVIAERRLRTLRDVAAELSGVDEQSDVFARLGATLERDRDDLPFTLTYLYDHDPDPDLQPGPVIDPLQGDGATDGDGASPGPPLPARLVAATGFPLDPGVIGDAGPSPADGVWPRPHPGVEPTTVLRRDFPRWVRDLSATLGPTMPHRALLVPLRTQPDVAPIGYFVAGLTPYRPADANLISFVRLLTDQVDSAIKTVRALETAQLRAEALAELDRVKTRFFANISHEFRTPLTLILGPLDRLRSAVSQETSHDPAHPATDLMAELDAMHGNALRLSKLVADVLDFSRLQAGKLPRSDEPLDLGAYTTELAEMFRSTVEQVGLRYRVDSPDLGLVQLDPALWERIVLNLLSNALKFTFDGEITLSLQHRDGRAILTVSDTGVGIPAEELPRLFERFHRVERSRARSSEGTGIGLALVSELTALLDGQVTVASTVDVGTTFTVTVPVTSVTHQRSAPVRVSPALGGTMPAAFLAETWRWTLGSDSGGDGDHDPRLGARPDGDDDGSRSHEGDLLVVDDNADMRAYLSRLLAPRFRVRTAVNGAEALDRIEEHRPDLVVSDVMMPEIDGVELVRRIRAHPDHAELPVILLTAAADPAATAKGLDVGADDYLVKPFTAENLLLRVSARLSAGQERRRRAALNQLAAAVATQTDPPGVLAQVLPVVKTWLEADATTLALVEDRGTDHVRLWHDPGYPGGVGERYRSGRTSNPEPFFTAIRSGDPVVLDSPAAIAAAHPELVDDCRAAGIAAVAVVPLRTGTGAVPGSLAVTWRTGHRAGDEERDLLDAVARIVADAVGRITAADEERRFLREFQARLLEIDHRSTHAVVNVAHRPSQGHALVGGDWYDVVTLADRSIGITIGDVVGSGLAAAAAMSQLRSAARLAALSQAEPSQVLTLLDAYTQRSPDARCASVLFARLHPDGRLRWCSAGHPPPLLITDTGARYLDGGLRPLLGCASGGSAPEDVLSLPPAATLVLFTDGLVERRGETIDEGLGRLARIALAHRHLSVGRLSECLLRLLTPPGGLRDDVALIVVRTTGQRPDRHVDAFRSDSAQLAPARRRFRHWLAGFELAPATVDDLVLAFGEMAANAVEHGNRSNGELVVGVEAAVTEGRLELSVTDTGTWTPDSHHSQRQGRGRGFSILDTLADQVEITTGGAGTTVTFTRMILAEGDPTG